MASGSNRLITGLITAAVVVLAVGGLVAYGAGAFNSEPAAGTIDSGQAAPAGDVCPITGCSDKASAAAASGAPESCSEKSGCCPSMKVGVAVDAVLGADACSDESGCDASTKMCGTATASTGAEQGCSGGEDADAACGEQKECCGSGSCDSCSVNN